MILSLVRRAVAFAFALSILVASPAASSVGWSRPRQLVGTSVQTFWLQLAVNHAGVAVGAWYSGPPPPVNTGAVLAPTRTSWRGDKVVVALGSITHGLGKPAVIAKNDTDLGKINVALSGAGVAYVAWPGSDGPGWMVVTARAGRLSSPRMLALPRGARLDRFAFGLDGPVDALSDRPNGHGYTIFCTRMEPDGRSGRTFIVAHPYVPNPCHLPHTGGMSGSVPPDAGNPPGYQRATYSLISRSDGSNAALAIWDDLPDTGPAYTSGLFYAVRHS